MIFRCGGMVLSLAATARTGRPKYPNLVFAKVTDEKASANNVEPLTGICPASRHQSPLRSPTIMRGHRRQRAGNIHIASKVRGYALLTSRVRSEPFASK